MPEPFIGVGTGRCGTHSLVEIVRACEDCEVTHEAFQLSWYGGAGPEMGEMLKKMMEGKKDGRIVGEVSLALLPHIEEIRSVFPDLRVVALHRDKASMVESFMALGTFMLRPSDKRKWVDKSIRPRSAQSIKMYPIIDAASTAQAFEFWWEMYETLMARISGDVFHLQMEDLSDDARVVELFDYLGISGSKRTLIDKRKWFDREEIRDKREQLTRMRAV